MDQNDIVSIKSLSVKSKKSKLGKLKKKNVEPPPVPKIEKPVLRKSVITYSHRSKVLMISNLVGYTSGKATKLVKKAGILVPVPIANHTS